MKLFKTGLFLVLAGLLAAQPLAGVIIGANRWTIGNVMTIHCLEDWHVGSPKSVQQVGQQAPSLQSQLLLS